MGGWRMTSVISLLSQHPAERQDLLNEEDSLLLLGETAMDTALGLQPYPTAESQHLGECQAVSHVRKVFLCFFHILYKEAQFLPAESSAHNYVLGVAVCLRCK